MSKDYYDILGVKKKASHKEIQKAYRKLARKHHPDVNPGDAEAETRFKEISEAYTVLGNKEKRREYDEKGMRAEGFPPPGAGSYRTSAVDIGDLDDLLGQFFRGGARPPHRGADLHAGIRVSFEESFHGAQKTFSLVRRRSCDSCRGAGHPPDDPGRPCLTCAGRGVRKVGQGAIRVDLPCDACRGVGRQFDGSCRECGGTGSVSTPEQISVRIPPGAKSGSSLRLAGKGEIGRDGGPPGDLFLEITVNDSPRFERIGNDLYRDVPISYADAVLGTEVTVPSMDGDCRIRVPAETKGGQQVRLSGKGFPSPSGGPPGDLFARMVITPPAEVTEKMKELLRELQRLEQEAAS